MTRATIQSLRVGKPQTIGKNVWTAIIKEPVHTGSCFLHETHLSGDEQADTINHGGHDKAVCAYPYEHYAYWNDRLETSLPLGGFGENITTQHLLEKDVRIGDTFRWGKAIVQVSQPRKPCYKLAERHGIKKLPLYVEETGYSGYYFRVLAAGEVQASDALELIERRSDVSVADVNEVTFYDAANKERVVALLALPELAGAWKDVVRKKYERVRSSAEEST
ncbi:MOSC domain-containing protein [Salsuginibacillus kocurii]|uniref:MOSC domain-containing protein n=1 Tax=Salsuginibacillus kocurii TaxID=427078 RepID=UPI00037B79CC|nr:MOSC domain-containing protein [Salsuginibacillus kocurii]